jgi:hypothetical protein
MRTSRGAKKGLPKDLDEDERSMIFKMIDSFLTKKKFKDFFDKNVASL